MPPSLTNNELAIIAELGQDRVVSQREISQNVGLSLGLTNLLLRRLARKGYIKAKQLTWNKTQYLLTLKGSMEKARKSLSYAAFIWGQAHKLVKTVQETVAQEYKGGLRRCAVVAGPEAELMIRRALAEADLPELDVQYTGAYEHVRSNVSVIFTATEEPQPKAPKAKIVPLLNTVDLIFNMESL
jgi:hypothetical protein